MVQTRIRRQAAAGLWVVLAVSGGVLAVRAAVGKIPLPHASANPMPAEMCFAVSAVLLLMLNAGARRLAALPEKRARLAPLWILFAAGLAAWVWTFSFPFVSDDYTHITNGLRATLLSIPNLFRTPSVDHFFRPWAYTAFAAEAGLAGTARVAWHAFSFALHTANSALLYLILAKRHRSWIALAASSFFLLHGARPEPVTWIAAQFDLWAVFFFLISLLAFFNRLATGALKWEAVSLIALTLALLSKESAYVLPVVMLLAFWLGSPAAEKPMRRTPALRILLPPFLITGVVFAYRWWLFGGVGGYRTPDSGAPFIYSVGWLRTSKALLLRPPATLLFPVNWTRQPEWWLAAGFLLAMAAWAVVAAARPARRPMWFALGFTLLAAIPVHQFLLIGPDLEKSRVLYLPSVGFALLLASALDALRPRTAALAAAGIVVFQAAALEHNLIIWRNVAELAQRTCSNVARAQAASPQPLTVSDVPNVVDGVYFLHAGLGSCVAWAAGDPLRDRIIVAAPNPSLIWDDSRREFVPSAR